MTSRVPNQTAPDQTVSLMSTPHVCVLGGGFGGLYTALYLQRLAKRHSRHGRLACRITLVEPKERFLFTPLLYEVVTGELQPWHIAPSYGKLLGQTSVQVRRALVQGVDLDRRRVSLDTGETLDYDYLVLAVGSRNRLDVDGAATHAQPFRSLADAERLEERLRELEAIARSPQIAVIGGGPNGIEIACKLADRLGDRSQVHLIERGDRLLKTFSSGSQRAANRALAQRGVRLHLETGVEAIAADRVTLSQIGQPFDLPADLVLWTAGTQMPSWLQDLPCQHNAYGQLTVHPTLQLVDYPNVYVLGDNADLRDGKGVPVPATAQVAYQQASCAAANLWKNLQGRSQQRFRYLHLGEMMTLGHNAAVVSSFGIVLSGSLAQLIRKWVYAQRLPTLHHRLEVMGYWLFGGLLERLPHHWQRALRQQIQSWLRPQKIRSSIRRI